MSGVGGVNYDVFVSDVRGETRIILQQSGLGTRRTVADVTLPASDAWEPDIVLEALSASVELRVR